MDFLHGARRGPTADPAAVEDWTAVRAAAKERVDPGRVGVGPEVRREYARLAAEAPASSGRSWTCRSSARRRSASSTATSGSTGTAGR